MKYWLLTFLNIALLSVSFHTCTQKAKEEETELSEETDWPKMDSFHLIMAEAFHPYKDSANLEPVKRLSEEIAQEAQQWTLAALPDKEDNEDMKSKLNHLKEDSRALSDMIKANAPDGDIGVSLKALHESFHSIMEAWNGSGEHQHQH